jgi:hypothetical protein
MTYIIENAHILKGQAISDTSLLIDGERILAAKLSFNLYNHIRMDADDYIMTPTHVLLDSNLPFSASFQERKDYYIKNFIMRGSTIVLTIINVHFDRELDVKLKQAKSDLIDSPIDYVIGISIPPRMLQPGFIRKCKRAKIPVIFLQIKDMEELNRIPWGWIKEALFPYNSPLVPVFTHCSTKKEKLLLTKYWSELLKKEKVPAVHEEIPELSPISRTLLKKTGIFPHKSNLNSGGEVSYNLYSKTDEMVYLDENELYNCHNSSLAVTVDKGKVLRAGNEVYYRPGKGENVIISTPGFFTANH